MYLGWAIFVGRFNFLKMKVLLINNFDDKNLIGGVEHYLVKLTNYLKKEKNDIDYKWYGQRNAKSNLLNKIHDKSITEEIIHIIDEFQPDVIHCFSIGAPVSPHFMKYAHQLKIPIIFSFRDYYYTSLKTLNVSVKSTLLLIKKAFHQRLINQYINFFTTPNDKLTLEISKIFKANGETLSNPILIDDDFQSEPLDHSDFLLYVGRLVPEKGIQTLLVAFKNVLKFYPNQMLFMIGDGPFKTVILKFIKSNNLQKNIFVLNNLQREELVKYYKTCKFTILPSEIHESFGNVILESFYFNKTVICSDLVGLVDEIESNQLGLIFKHKSINELSSTILKLLGNDKLCYELANNGHHFSKKFTMQVHIEKLLKIYQNVLSQNLLTNAH